MVPLGNLVVAARAAQRFALTAGDPKFGLASALLTRAVVRS
jgi:hypothetical protein